MRGRQLLRPAVEDREPEEDDGSHSAMVAAAPCMRTSQVCLVGANGKATGILRKTPSRPRKRVRFLVRSEGSVVVEGRDEENEVELSNFRAMRKMEERAAQFLSTIMGPLQHQQHSSYAAAATAGIQSATEDNSTTTGQSRPSQRIRPK